MKKILVVGVSGVLGKLICKEVLRVFNKECTLIATDYKVDRGKKTAISVSKNVIFRPLDVSKKENINNVVKDVDVVIVAIKQSEPLVQEVCTNKNILCIDVTPYANFVASIQAMNKSKSPSVAMSGFFPGLSGVLAKEAISGFQCVDEVNIGLLQSTNANVGVSGIIDMLKIISKPVKIVNNKYVPGFSEKRMLYFLEGNAKKQVRLIEHAERKYLCEKLNIGKLNYWTSWNKQSFNKMISICIKIKIIDVIKKLKKTRFLSKVVKHNPNKDENASLTVEVKGKIDEKNCIRTLSLSTFSDYETTAMVTAALTKIVLQKEIKGTNLPHELTHLDELLSVMDCPRISTKIHDHFLD